MYLTEEEQIEYKTNSLYVGFKTNETSFFETSDYKKLREVMLDTLPQGNKNRFKYNLCSKSDILKFGKYVIEKHFPNIDLSVNYTNGDDFLSQVYSKFGYEPEKDKYDDIIKYINDNIKKVHILDVPVDLHLSNDLNNGSTYFNWFYSLKKLDEEHFKQIPYCLNKIYLSGKCNELTRTIYIHEMTHALVDRNQGTIENELNREALSIFMERVAASDLVNEKDFIDVIILDRLVSTKYNMMRREYFKYCETGLNNKHINEIYLISTLYATDLFNTYFKANNKVKKEIDLNVGRVLTGDIHLEELFNIYDATLEKGAKIMKKQLKKYTEQVMLKGNN